MAKKKIFISHIGEESEIAQNLKDKILTFTNKGVEVFVSSDSESIGLGRDWEDIVKDEIKQCDMMLVIVSKNSLNRPWISFETGAAWVKGIAPIPICHGGIDKGSLPKPFSILQSVNADINGLTGVFRSISILREEEFSSVDLTELVSIFNEFDKKYYEIDEIQEFLKLFDEYSISVLKSLDENSNYKASIRLEKENYNKLLDLKKTTDLGKLFLVTFNYDFERFEDQKLVKKTDFEIALSPSLVEKINK